MALSCEILYERSIIYTTVKTSYKKRRRESRGNLGWGAVESFGKMSKMGRRKLPDFKRGYLEGSMELLRSSFVKSWNWVLPSWSVAIAKLPRSPTSPAASESARFARLLDGSQIVFTFGRNEMQESYVITFRRMTLPIYLPPLPSVT
jgi:hypothetical protein